MRSTQCPGTIELPRYHTCRNIFFQLAFVVEYVALEDSPAVALLHWCHTLISGPKIFIIIINLQGFYPDWVFSSWFFYPGSGQDNQWRLFLLNMVSRSTHIHCARTSGSISSVDFSEWIKPLQLSMRDALNRWYPYACNWILDINSELHLLTPRLTPQRPHQVYRWHFNPLLFRLHDDPSTMTRAATPINNAHIVSKPL